MAFLFSDASYDHTIGQAGIGIVDMYDHERHAEVVRCANSTEAEWIALLGAIELAAKKEYKHVVFVYDCRSINTSELKCFFAPIFLTMQFLWLRRDYLRRTDRLARWACPADTSPVLRKPKNGERTMAQEYKALKKMPNRSKLKKFLVFLDLPKRVKVIVMGLLSRDLCLINTMDEIPT